MDDRDLELKEGIYFEGRDSSRDISKFIKDVAMKEKKKYKIVQSGPKKTYTCEGPECKYSISALRRGFCKHPRSRRDVPPGAWYVANITGEHSQHCQMVNMARSMSSTQMVANKEFRSAMLVPNISYVGIHRMVHKNEAVVMGKKDKGLIQRARKKYDSMENQDVKESYVEIPSFLRALKKKNPESRVCLQMDSQGRFYHFFLSYPFLIFSGNDYENALLPVFEMDAGHMKQEAGYNGVLIQLIRKAGDRRSIPQASALVPKEDTNNYMWFLCNCIKSGIDFDKAVIFSDRGHQMNAQRQLEEAGISLSIKNCSRHIYRNVIHQCKIAPLQATKFLLPLMYKLQGASNFDQYMHGLAKIAAAFPAKEEKTLSDVMCYLLRLHPTQWSVFGNSPLSKEDELLMQMVWGSTHPYGSARPLFGTRSTNGAEGEMNAALWNGSRTKTPRESMNHCFLRALDIFHTFREDVKQQKAARQELISEAVVMELLNGQNGQTAMAICNQGYGEYAVSPSTLPSQSHTVNVEGATCSCSYYYQKQFPCTHIAAVLPQHDKLVGVRHSLLDFCHDAYKTNTVNNALQSRYNTGCPKVPDATEVNTRATYLRPAPWYYGQGKASDLHPVNPGRMLKRRFRSNGEHLGAKCHKRSNAVTHNHSSVVLQDIQSNKDIKKYNMDLGIGVIESVSNKKRCSRCRVIGHNATSCHLPPAEDNKSKDQMSDQSPLEPGEYLMGEDPMVPLAQAHRQSVKAALRINDTDFFFLAHLTQSNDIGPFLECFTSLRDFQKAMCLVSDATQNLSEER